MRPSARAATGPSARRATDPPIRRASYRRGARSVALGAPHVQLPTASLSPCSPSCSVWSRRRAARCAGAAARSGRSCVSAASRRLSRLRAAGGDDPGAGRDLVGGAIRGSRAGARVRAQVRSSTRPCASRGTRDRDARPSRAARRGDRPGASCTVASTVAGIRSGRGDRVVRWRPRRDSWCRGACAARTGGARSVGRGWSDSPTRRAFAWSSEPPMQALLVDDVLTTGATLRACAAALRSGGAERVTGLTFARSGYTVGVGGPARRA